MVEYKDTGEPIPDGRIEVMRKGGFEITHFKDMKFIRETPQCLVIVFEGRRQQIPWHEITDVYVHNNSDEYVEASRAWNNNQPPEYFDTRHGGKCIACSSRS